MGGRRRSEQMGFGCRNLSTSGNLFSSSGEAHREFIIVYVHMIYICFGLKFRYFPILLHSCLSMETKASSSLEVLLAFVWTL